MKINQYIFRIYYFDTFGRLSFYRSFNYPNSVHRNRMLKKTLVTFSERGYKIQDIVKSKVEVEL